MKKTAAKKTERAKIFHMLQAYGIRRNSRLWSDYENCKRLILNRQVLQSTYSERIDLILDYIEL